MNDSISEWFRKSINILFVANPRGTSIGVLIGVVIDGLLGLFSPILKTFSYFDFAAVKLWHLIGLGVLSINLPSYLKRKEIDISILNALKYIDDQKRSRAISDLQAKHLYSELHRKVLESVTFKIDEAPNRKAPD